MECFSTFLPSWILAFFDKTCNFFIFFDIYCHHCLLSSLSPRGQENLISGWIISYLKIFSCHGIGFNFSISQILAIFIFGKISIFFRFLKIFVIFEFFQLQGPGNLFWGLLIGHCIVSSNNGMVFNILMPRILSFFW